MNTELEYSLAFITGMLGAPHCIGMCSGLVGGVFMRWGRRVAWPLVVYHGTRVLTYVVLGVAGALLGRVLEQSGVFGKGQGVLMIAAGVVVTLLGLGIVRRATWGARSGCAGVATDSAVCAATPIGRASWALPFGGLINGLMPCSLVFTVAIKAAAAAEPLQAGLFMLFFGLGTLPGVLPVSLLAAFGARADGFWARLGGICVIVLGIKTTYEGMVFFNIMRGLAN